jgi:hypothetical protein
MIVPNMKSKELFIEVFKDLDVVDRKATYLTLSLRRAAIKSKAKYVHRVFHYKSLRHNKWLIYVDYYVKEPSYTVVVYYNNHYGLNGILVEGGNQALIHFTSHFLERYNERFLHKKGASSLDLLKRFIPTNNLQIIKAVQKIDSDKSRILGRFEEGVGLGYEEVFHDKGKVFHHFKTFISNDMIRDHQIEDFNILGSYYDTYWEEIYGGGKKRA